MHYTLAFLEKRYVDKSCMSRATQPAPYLRHHCYASTPSLSPKSGRDS